MRCVWVCAAAVIRDDRSSYAFVWLSMLKESRYTLWGKNCVFFFRFDSRDKYVFFFLMEQMCSLKMHMRVEKKKKKQR